MVKIVIENLAEKEVFVNDISQPVLKILHGNFLDWMHACGGKGRCTTCKMIVLSGMQNISPRTVAEKRYQAEGALAENERLACQVRVSASIRIRVPDDYKLPHVLYTS
jgi:2Fe-2S ferredoxin